MEYKGDVDLVTEADRSSEALIKQRLAAAFPDHGIYGEEGTRERLAAEYRWYVDPLDGTTNFAHGFPAFCVVLGCEHRPPGLAADQDGEMVAGVIYDPLRNDIFEAERGQGTWLNGRRVHASKTKSLQESLTATGFPSQKRHENPNIHFYQQMTLRSHGVRRAGSAALDLAYVACGRLDGFWEFKLNPWDTSAGSLMVEESGGTMTHLDGSNSASIRASAWPPMASFSTKLSGCFQTSSQDAGSSRCRVRPSSVPAAMPRSDSPTPAPLLVESRSKFRNTA